MTDPTPFEPSSTHMDDIGPPPVTPDTAILPLSPETKAAFYARATEAAIEADLREKLMGILTLIGNVAAQKLLGL